MKTYSLNKRTPKEWGARAGNYYKIYAKHNGKEYLGKFVKVGKDKYKLIHMDFNDSQISSGDIRYLVKPSDLVLTKLSQEELVLLLLTHGLTLPKQFTEKPHDTTTNH